MARKPSELTWITPAFTLSWRTLRQHFDGLIILDFEFLLYRASTETDRKHLNELAKAVPFGTV